MLLLLEAPGHMSHNHCLFTPANNLKDDDARIQ